MWKLLAETPGAGPDNPRMNAAASDATDAALDPRQDPLGFLRALYACAVSRALPADVTAAHLPPPPPNGRTLVLGAGKAGGAMAAAVDALWPADAPISGLVVTRYDHVPPAYKARPGRIEVVEARHPVPDEAGRQAAQRIVDLTRGLTADDLVLCLISGGGSALLSLPAPGLDFAAKQAINSALLKSGAAIDEMNTVRKHLSAIKGGRLAALCAPARVVTLLISDVPGDDPQVIASGPTVADASTCADALAILRRYAIAIPDAARAGLDSGTFETPKPGDALFAGHAVRMIATPQDSLAAAAALARQHGLDAHILSDAIEGESREVGKVHAALARAVAQRGQPFQRPCVILSGGETTVTVRERPGQVGGRGGRASEFLLGCAIALQGQAGVWALSADTDGIDGIEDNAGAVLAPDTLARAAARGLKPAEFLDRNDAYSFFAALGDLVVPGPTYTNVNDFRALLVL
jgi:hydroxypyruvate reductase